MRRSCCVRKKNKQYYIPCTIQLRCHGISLALSCEEGLIRSRSGKSETGFQIYYGQLDTDHLIHSQPRIGLRLLGGTSGDFYFLSIPLGIYIPAES